MISRAGSSRIEWEKTAAMVVAYERPDYFRHVVASFESNPEADELPFWFFLDHSPADEGRQVEKISNSCSIRDKTIVRRGENLGTGRNIIDGLRTLFDQEPYDSLLVPATFSSSAAVVSASKIGAPTIFLLPLFPARTRFRKRNPGSPSRL